MNILKATVVTSFFLLSSCTTHKLKIQYADNAHEPGMVSIPEGSFSMGCVSGESCFKYEMPTHNVTVKAFFLSETEITFNQWDACVNAGWCTHRADDNGWGRGDRPVINVNWHDAQEYVGWLRKLTNKPYRLPTEAEWEYAARANTDTQFSWGNQVERNNANCSGCGSQWDKLELKEKQTAPVRSFQPNPFGLYDMHGNVSEWTQDCWNFTYEGAPTNGDAWQTGYYQCAKRVLRGGSWFEKPIGIRSATRFKHFSNYRSMGTANGFRVARAL